MDKNTYWLVENADQLVRACLDPDDKSSDLKA